MTRFDEMISEEKLQAAVRASAASVPDDFIWNTERMIDRLPRKERLYMRNKLSVGLVLTIILCMLAATAVAAVLLTGRELVEQEVLPMALENDLGAVNESFTNAELMQIVALAEENGITLSNNILSALEKGEGYWEEEVIMSLAKSQFGPYPGQWTLEEQYWFEETVVAIGFKDYNQCRVPGEGELSYEEAYVKAKEYIIAHGWEEDTSALDDREKYDLWRSYKAVRNEDGTIQEPDWYFWFEPKDVNLPEYIVELDKAGQLLNLEHTAGLEDRLAAGEMPHYEVLDTFQLAYGSMNNWLPETYVAYVDALRRADLTNISRATQAYLDTNYILPPEGALTREQAIEIAKELIGGNDIRVGAVICFVQDGRAMWKVCIASDSNRISDMVEMDCMTGEIIQQYMDDSDGNAVQFYVPKQVYDEICGIYPTGNG